MRNPNILFADSKIYYILVAVTMKILGSPLNILGASDENIGFTDENIGVSDEMGSSLKWGVR